MTLMTTLDVEATSSSETESIANDDKLSLEEKLSDIDVFEKKMKMLVVMRIKNQVMMMVAQKMKLK